MLAMASIGDEICITNYIMDILCINLGYLLDDRNTMTLENPEKHSFHCLLDVDQCRNSGYMVLTDKDEATGMHCLGYRLEDTDTIYKAGIAAGMKGYCTDCTGDETKPRNGYRATIKGTVKELGDRSDGPLGAPLLESIQVLDASEECDVPTVVNPVCMAPPPGPNNTPSGPPPAPAKKTTEDCTTSMCESVLTDGYILRYQVNVPSETTLEECEGCTISMELTYDGEGWVGIGFSKDGQMVGSEAVIGSPAIGGQKYTLSSRALEGVQPMPANQQSLIDCNVQVKDGQTIMKFTKMMKEEGEIEITSGENTFIWAHGSDNALGYHAARASFKLDLSGAPSSEPEPEPATPSVTPPGPAAPAKKDENEPTGPAKDCTKTLCESVLTEGFIMRYQVNVPSETTVDVCEGCTISMELVYDGEAWAGIGFSTDGAMVGSEAVIGNSEKGVLKYTLSSKALDGVQPMPENQQTLVDTSVEVKDGQTTVKFTKIMKEAGEIEINPGDNTFIWAHGSGDALAYHAARASFDLNLSSGASEELSVPNKAAWLAHGIMAFLSWGVLVPYAVQSSILRDLLPKGPLWFQMHRAFNASAYVLFIAFFAIAVAFTSKEQGEHFGNSHQKMGLAMFIMATFQVAGGLFRPHLPAPDSDEEKTPVRKGWEVGHRVLGVTLLACGFWQMSAGIDLYAIKYSVSESKEGMLNLAYWVWVGGMSGIIVLGVVYSRLCKVEPKESADTLKSYL